MQDEHRAAIRNCFSSLVEQTDLDTMVSSLYEKGVFSEAMTDPYKDPNKEPRLRKRSLYMDVMRRGPHAFGHLVDALTEAGYWELARELDPKKLPVRRPPEMPHPINARPKSTDSEFLSISEAKKMGNNANNPNFEKRPLMPPLNPVPPPPYVAPEINPVKVIKSTKFMEDNGKDIKLYPTRGRRRGVLVVFSYIEFHAQLETYRRGVDVDCQMLKHLFSEIGFEVISFQNLTLQETLIRMKNLPLKGAECVFIVISSHGYGRDGSWDTDIRCSDGGLISAHTVVDNFNNQNCPALIGIPKVFIFQMCRRPVSHDSLKNLAECFIVISSHGYGRDGSWDTDIRCSDGGLISAHTVVDRFNNQNCPALIGIPKVFIFQMCRGENRYQELLSAPTDGAPFGSTAPRSSPAGRRRDRVYSDILIAHSTLPGFVSHRDMDKGSWFIQALCEVFAANAHDCHVVTLFTLVDKALQDRFHVQTSVVENWGFNCKLYLHPGLFED